MKNPSLMKSASQIVGRSALALSLLISLMSAGCKKETGTTDSGTPATNAGAATDKKREVHKAPDGAKLKLAFSAGRPYALGNCPEL